MSLLIKNFFLMISLTFVIQANSNQQYMNSMELGLKEAAAIPALMKDYIMVEMNSKFNDPSNDLKKEIKRFDNLQKRLLQLTLDTKIKDKIEKHQQMWSELKSVLQKPKTKEGFKEFKKYATPLRESIREMIRESRIKIDSKTCDCVYYTGKLSAISQKFASLYMLLKWGMNSEKLHKDMKNQREMYIATLAKLKEMSSVLGKNTNKILKKLENDMKYFSFLESSDTFAPALAYSKTNAMYKYSNEMMVALLKK